MAELLRSKRSRVTALVAFVIACFALGEMSARRLLPRPGFHAFATVEPPGLLVRHPARGYGYAPNYSGTRVGDEYSITIETNSLGLRETSLSADERVEVLAVGDSFTVGYGVEREEAWPARLQSAINSSFALSCSARVVNAGVSGYSLSQIRMLAEELTRELEPKLIVLGLYASRYWRIADPYVLVRGHLILKSEKDNTKVVEGGFLRSSFERTAPRSIDFWLKENCYLGGHLIELGRLFRQKIRFGFGMKLKRCDIRERLGSLFKELRSLSQVAVDAHAALIIMLVNHQAESGDFDRRGTLFNAEAESFAEGLGLTVFDPIPAFERLSGGTPRFRLGRDHHWSKDAHHVAASELARFLEEQKLLGSICPTQPERDPAGR